MVHLANLLALFFNSFAITAPRWVSILSLQSIPVTLESNSFNALTRVVSASPFFMPLASLTPLNSQRQTSSVFSSTLHLRYLYATESLSSSPKKGTGSPTLTESFGGERLSTNAVHLGGLHGELLNAVDVLFVVRDRLLRRLGHGELVKVTVGALVQVNFAILLLDDDVPRIVGTQAHMTAANTLSVVNTLPVPALANF